MTLLEVLEKKSETSVKSKRNIDVLTNFLKLFLEQEYGYQDILLEKITHQFWTKFQEYSLKKDHSKNYLNIHVAMINGIINGLPETIKVPLVKRIVKSDKPKHKSLTQEQVTMIEESEPSKERDLFLLQCETGMAYNDLIKITRDHVLRDPEGLMLQYVRGKTESSNGRPARMILTEKALMILEEYNYDMSIKYWTYSRRLHEIGKKIGIELTSHVARHTFGTLMAEKGWSLDHISSMMAHSTVTTTKIYSNVTNRALFEAQKRLDLYKEISTTIIAKKWKGNTGSMSRKRKFKKNYQKRSKSHPKEPMSSTS